MAFRLLVTGVATKLSWVAPWQTTGLYPRARILDSDGDLVTTVNLTANATITYYYEGSWTPSVEGEYRVVYDVFTDAGYTVYSTEIGSADEYIRVQKTLTYQSYYVGGGGEGGDISEDNIKKIIDGVWSKILKTGKTADEILSNVSQFNVKTDIVKTDLVIPDNKYLDKDINLLISQIVTNNNIQTEIKNLIKKELSPLIKNNEIKDGNLKYIVDGVVNILKMLYQISNNLNQTNDLINDYKVEKDIQDNSKEIKDLKNEFIKQVEAMKKFIFMYLSGIVNVNNYKEKF